MDLSAGRGGDLSKWKDFDEIWAVDIDSKNIGTKETQDENTLLGRVNKLKKRNIRYRKKKINAIVSDMSSLELQKHPSLENKKVDVITIFFSIHYIFNDVKKINHLFKNITKLLKPNGVCVITTFDGEKVFNRLQKSINQDGDKKYIEKYDMEGNLIYRIQMTDKFVKKMNDKNSFPSDENSINYPIDVTFETFGTQREYLVNSHYLVNMARLHGLEIISQEELHKDFNRKVFYNGCDTFENLSKNMNNLGLSFSKKILQLTN